MRHIVLSDSAAGEAARPSSTTKTYLCVTTRGVGLRTESSSKGYISVGLGRGRDKEPSNGSTRPSACRSWTLETGRLVRL
jgi:hypothetical protein